MTILHKMLEYFTNLCYCINRNGKKFKGDSMNMGCTNFINEELENMAMNILINNDMLRLPVDLISIANNNGIDVYRTELPDDISGAIKYNDKVKKFQILINKNENYLRQRFTLAHELAHYFIDKPKLLQEKNVHYDPMYRKINNQGEKRVDYLAGALLMNQDILRELYDINPSITFLSKIFKVSEASVIVRLKMLGLNQ